MNSSDQEKIKHSPTSAGEDAGKGEPAGAAMAEISMEGTKKLNTELPCDQLYHPWAYSRRNSMPYNRDTCTSMFTAVLFTVPRR